MAGSSLLERKFNTQNARGAELQDVLYEEQIRQAQAAPQQYDSFSAQDNGARTSSAMPVEEANKASAYNPTLERIQSYYETPVAPSRKKVLFEDYQYADGEVMRKTGDTMTPVFEAAVNVVEEPYFDIPEFEYLQDMAMPQFAVESEPEEDDALPTRRTMETVIRPAAAVQEMALTETRTGFRAAIASLSAKTKAVLISVLSAIVLAIVLICVNTGIIRSLDSDLTNLRSRATQERTTYEYLQEESNRYTDPDSEIVAEWAENNGMTK